MSKTQRTDAVMLDERDNVATALRPLEPGAVARIDAPGGAREASPLEAIPLCHKLALANLPAGTTILKYGAPIGRLTVDVKAGQMVHVHNMQSLRGRR